MQHPPHLFRCVCPFIIHVHTSLLKSLTLPLRLYHFHTHSLPGPRQGLPVVMFTLCQNVNKSLHRCLPLCGRRLTDIPFSWIALSASHVDQILLCNPLQPPRFYATEEIKHVDELCVLSAAASETAMCSQTTSLPRLSHTWPASDRHPIQIDSSFRLHCNLSSMSSGRNVTLCHLILGLGFG